LKGFFSGLLWGAILCAIGLVIISQMTLTPSEGTKGPLPALQPELSEPAGADAAPAAEALPAQAEAPAPQAPAPSLLPQADAPRQGGSRPGTNTGPDGAPAPAPIAPEAGAAPDATVASIAVPDPNDAIAPQAPARPPDAPGTEPGPAMVDLPPPPPLTPEEQALAAAASPPRPEVQPDPETAPLPPEAELKPAQPLSDVEGKPVSGDQAGAADRPATGVSDPAESVVTGRLPRIGDAPETDPAPQDPINRYARAFGNPQGKPVFAIVLIDRGEPGLDRAALAALPFPVTFVLDPTLPDVARLADVYVAAGQEVAMLATAIPAGATAADLEVTFGAHGAALPQAVAVMDLGEGGFQGNRPLATLVIPIIQGQGRGLLTYDAGLNAADQVARRDQLRAGTIFRRIDPAGQPADDFRRVLDRAAFKAAQEGRVAVVGEASPATVAALLEWTVEGRAAALALAPATAVMVAR
jgi:polysaccharide deacetylase 2 family uncharacterized protein YibQ